MLLDTRMPGLVDHGSAGVPSHQGIRPGIQLQLPLPPVKVILATSVGG